MKYIFCVFFQTIQQSIQSHESAVRSVIERGEALLETIRDPSISENIGKLKTDYHDLCNDAQVLSCHLAFDLLSRAFYASGLIRLCVRSACKA